MRTTWKTSELDKWQLLNDKEIAQFIVWQTQISSCDIYTIMYFLYHKPKKKYQHHFLGYRINLLGHSVSQGPIPIKFSKVLIWVWSSAWRIDTYSVNNICVPAFFLIDICSLIPKCSASASSPSDPLLHFLLFPSFMCSYFSSPSDLFDNLYFKLFLGLIIHLNLSCLFSFPHWTFDLCLLWSEYTVCFLAHLDKCPECVCLEADPLWSPKG